MIKISIPILDVEGTGKRIRILRKLNGMSVAELQDIFGFNTPQAIYKWEQGVNIPTTDNLIILAKVFDCDINDILCVR